MRYSSHEVLGKNVVVRLSFKDMTLDERDALAKELGGLIGPGLNYVIDMSGIGFLSSLMVSILIIFKKKAANNGGKVVLCGLKKDAKAVIEITKMDKLFGIFDTEQEALGSLDELPGSKIPVSRDKRRDVRVV